MRLLGKTGRRRRGFKHYFGSIELKPRLSVEAFDFAIKNQQFDIVAESYMRLAMGIVGTYLSQLGSDQNADELVGAAMHAVCDAVGRVKRGHYALEAGNENQHFTAYVTIAIHREIANVFEQSQVVKISKYMRRIWAESGITFKALPSCVSLTDMPIKTGSSTIEILEILDKVIRTDRERKIMDLRIEGLSDREIATKLRVSPMTVNNARSQIAARMLEHL